jgi:hypothetical protein
MKNLSLLFIAFLLLQLNTLAQAPDTMWTMTLGSNNSDGGWSVQQTTDGGYIIVGFTEAYNAGYPDVWLIKTDAFGNTLWTKIFGGNHFEEGSSVQQTTDGGYIITGYTFSFSAGYSDVWLIKTNSFGDTLWSKTYGGSSTDGGASVQQTTDGGYVLVGGTSSFGAGYGDVWLIKTNASGDTLWTKTFEGGHFDSGYSVKQTADGGYIITGWTYTYGTTYGDVWLLKTSENGDTLWTKTYGDVNDEEGFSICLTEDGGYVIVGYTNSFGSGGKDVLIIRTDADGEISWTKLMGGTEDDVGISIQATEDGGYIVAGYTYSFGAGEDDVWLIKLAPDSPSVVRNDIRIVNEYSLEQNHPNPFNPKTKIKYSIPYSSNVVIKVFDILGNEIETLVNEEKPVGSYEITWYAENLPSGVYFYELRVGSFGETKKMVLIK